MIVCMLNKYTKLTFMNVMQYTHTQVAHTFLSSKSTTTIYTIICLKSVCLSVSVRKLQVAILARSSREMSLTDRIVWQYIHEFASQFGLAFFYTRKTLINYYESRTLCILLLNGPAARPVTMHSATVTVEWPATRRCRYNCGNTKEGYI